MKVLADTRLVFARSLRLSLRTPLWSVLALVQPILYLVLFAPLLEQVAAVPGFPPGDAWQVFVPGLVIQLGLFGALSSGFGLVAEYRNGVVERMRVTPVSRFALLAGRVLRDVGVLVVQATILVVASVPFGLRAPLTGVLAGLGLTALLGITMSSGSYAVALVLKSEDTLAQLLNGVSLPLLLLSGILLPMSLAPGWLQGLSRANPLTYVVDGARALFRGEVTSGTVGVAVVVSLALAAVSVTLGTRTFRRESS